MLKIKYDWIVKGYLGCLKSTGETYIQEWTQVEAQGPLGPIFINYFRYIYIYIYINYNIFHLYNWPFPKL